MSDRESTSDRGTMLKTESLTKQFGDLIALHPLSLDVPHGEILALVGPNGAGKTTALKLMVGLLLPTGGRVWVDGHDVHRAPLEAKRCLAFIPDQPFLYEQLTVEELLSFIGGMYRLAPGILQERAASLLDLFHLNESATRRISELSYGMKSRVILIASLLHEPRLLIMDEPFFGLDPQTLRLIKRLLIDRASQGFTTLLSTHQLAIVEDVAHRVAIMDRGRVVALDGIEALKRAHGGSKLEELFFHLTGTDTP